MLHTDYTLFSDNPVRTLARFWAKIPTDRDLLALDRLQAQQGVWSLRLVCISPPGSGYAHVFSYRLHCGDIPDGLFSPASLRQPALRQPGASLPWYQSRQQPRRGRQRACQLVGQQKRNPGIAARGVAHWNSKLNEDTVREIRGLREAGCGSNWALGLRFGVSSATISRVVNRIDWGWVQ